jgi:heptosyltransferase-2
VKGRILVVRGGAIGDFILTLPAIAALRRQFPEAHLEVLGYTHIIELAVAGGLVNRGQSIEARALAGFFARNGDLAEDLSDYFSEFDLIVSYLYDPDGIFRTNVARCAPAQFIQGPHRPEETSGLHASKVFLEPLERLAIFEADPVPRLRLTALKQNEATSSSFSSSSSNPQEEPRTQTRTSRMEGRRSASPTLALHPGSGSESKNWPEEKWAVLLTRLLGQTGFNLLLVGGEAEGKRLERLTSDIDPARSHVARSLPLPDLARLLESCVAFIGHDSGISHLAAALDLPGIVLWGQSNEAVWRPQSEKVLLLRHQDGLAALGVEEVLEAFRALGVKSPKY